jgi:hydroxymethylpyrimidine pyrophosphatase-like HAD family hydrolase
MITISDLNSFTPNRRNYILSNHRKDGLIEWMKEMLGHSFILNAKDTYQETFIYFEELIAEYRNNPETSRLKELVPSVGKFHTPLALAQAFHIYDEKYSISKRTMIPPSVNEIRHILNLGQVISIGKDLRMISFDGDQTLYSDGGNFDIHNRELALSLIRLLCHGVKVILVTAAGYGLDGYKYEYRIQELLNKFIEEQMNESQIENFYVLGGECHFLFQCKLVMEDESSFPHTPAPESNGKGKKHDKNNLNNIYGVNLTNPTNTPPAAPPSHPFPNAFAPHGTSTSVPIPHRPPLPPGAHHGHSLSTSSSSPDPAATPNDIEITHIPHHPKESSNDDDVADTASVASDDEQPATLMSTPKEKRGKHFPSSSQKHVKRVRLMPVPIEEWQAQHLKGPKPFYWPNEEVQDLLDIAENTMKHAVDELKLRARILRKAKAVGVFPGGKEMAMKVPIGHGSRKLKQEALDEIVLRVSEAIRRRALTKPYPFPYCVFNGGKDAWIDVGNKSIGVQALQAFFGFYPEQCLHVGDQVSYLFVIFA